MDLRLSLVQLRSSGGIRRRKKIREKEIVLGAAYEKYSKFNCVKNKKSALQLNSDDAFEFEKV